MKELTVSNVDAWLQAIDNREPYFDGTSLLEVKQLARKVRDTGKASDYHDRLTWFSHSLRVNVTQVTHEWANTHIWQVQLHVEKISNGELLHFTKTFQWNTDPSAPIESKRFTSWIEGLTSLATSIGEQLDDEITILTEDKKFDKRVNFKKGRTILHKKSDQMIYFMATTSEFVIYSALINNKRALLAVPKHQHIYPVTRIVDRQER